MFTAPEMAAEILETGFATRRSVTSAMPGAVPSFATAGESISGVELKFVAHFEVIQALHCSADMVAGKGGFEPVVNASLPSGSEIMFHANLPFLTSWSYPRSYAALAWLFQLSTAALSMWQF